MFDKYRTRKAFLTLDMYAGQTKKKAFRISNMYA